MAGQRLQSLIALAAAVVLLLLLWISLAPLEPEDSVEISPPSPLPATTAATLLPSATPLADGELGLSFGTASLPPQIAVQSDSYTIPLRVYNHSAQAIHDVGVGLTWLRGGEAQRSGVIQMISLPPQSALTTTFTIDGGLFAGPGSYTYQAFLRVFVSEQSRGSVISASAVGVLTILPPDVACDTPPNLRLLPESLRIRNGLAIVQVRNDGSTTLDNVSAYAAWSDGSTEGSSSYSLGQIAPCGGETLALLSLGDGDEPAQGTSLRIWVEALPGAGEEQPVAEETLEDNLLSIEIP